MDRAVWLKHVETTLKLLEEAKDSLFVAGPKIMRLKEHADVVARCGLDSDEFLSMPDLKESLLNEAMVKKSVEEKAVMEKLGALRECLQNVEGAIEAARKKMGPFQGQNIQEAKCLEYWELIFRVASQAEAIMRHFIWLESNTKWNHVHSTIVRFMGSIREYNNFLRQAAGIHVILQDQ